MLVIPGGESIQLVFIVFYPFVEVFGENAPEEEVVVCLPVAGVDKALEIGKKIHRVAEKVVGHLKIAFYKALAQYNQLFERGGERVHQLHILQNRQTGTAFIDVCKRQLRIFAIDIYIYLFSFHKADSHAVVAEFNRFFPQLADVAGHLFHTILVRRSKKCRRLTID